MFKTRIYKIDLIGFGSILIGSCYQLDYTATLKVTEYDNDTSNDNGIQLDYTATLKVTEYDNDTSNDNG